MFAKYRDTPPQSRLTIGRTLNPGLTARAGRAASGFSGRTHITNRLATRPINPGIGNYT